MFEDYPAAAVYRPQTKLQPNQIRALVAAYESGATIQQLTEDHHLHRRTAPAHLQRAAVTIRPKQAANAQQAAEIVSLYQSGLSLRQVSDQTGVAYGSVRNYLLRAGVTMRPPIRPRQ
ncbi:MAG: hypothetical protein JWO63_3269 [Frankiales bacterium]|nr:hypothetical protein [Frankiales bacterium]